MMLKDRLDQPHGPVKTLLRVTATVAGGRGEPPGACGSVRVTSKRPILLQGPPSPREQNKNKNEQKRRG